MFWRKKPVDYNSTARLFGNLKHTGDLMERVDQLETKVMQLTCTHNFEIEKYARGSVVFRCSKCVQRKIKTSKQLTNEERQALNVVGGINA